MLKKGLVTLVCLTILSAVWSWAATTYSLRTQLTNPGGSLRVNNVTQSIVGIKYTNWTTAVDVVVTPTTGFRIAALTQNGSDVPGFNPAGATVHVAKPTVAGPASLGFPQTLPTQSVTATFESTNVVTNAPRTWQLQVKNVNYGGRINTTGSFDTAKNVVNYLVVGLTRLINYKDTSPITATVQANTGFKIKSVSTTGNVVFSNHTTTATITGIPANGKAVNTVLATYKRLSYVAYTHTVPFVNTPAPGPLFDKISSAQGVPPVWAPNGISPINPTTVYDGAIRLTVVPTDANNIIESINVTPRNAGPAVTVQLKDRYGAPVTLPHKGGVKVLITHIKSDIDVTATYSRDNTDEMQNCTSTCHATARQPVQDAAVQWNSSTHKLNAAVDCVSCHQTMPGPIVHGTVNTTTFTMMTTAGGLREGTNYCASCHNGTTVFNGAAVPSIHADRGADCASCHVSVHRVAVP